MQVEGFISSKKNFASIDMSMLKELVRDAIEKSVSLKEERQ